MKFYNKILQYNKILLLLVILNNLKLFNSSIIAYLF